MRSACFWLGKREGFSSPMANVVLHINMQQQFIAVSKLASMPCTFGLYQKNQRIVIGWKQEFLQCYGHWSIQISNLASFRKFCDQVIRYLSPVEVVFMVTNQYYLFQSLSQPFLKLGRVSHNQQIFKYQIRYLPQSLCPPYQAFYLECAYPLSCN